MARNDSDPSTKDGRFKIVQGPDTIEVEPEYTGGPRTGWLGDGSWRVVAHDVPIGVEDNFPSLHRTLMDGTTAREFRFVPYQDGLDIMSVDPTTGALKHVASYGGRWTGYDYIQNPSNIGRWSWFDTNGDGLETESEITHYTTPAGGYTGMPFVDTAGTIWMPQDGKIVKFPLQFATTTSGSRIPNYNFAHPVLVVDVAPDFTPAQVKVAGNGDIWATGGGAVITVINPALPRSTWIARYTSNGDRTLLRPTPESLVPAFAVDSYASAEPYIFTGHCSRRIFDRHAGSRRVDGGQGLSRRTQ